MDPVLIGLPIILVVLFLGFRYLSPKRRLMCSKDGTFDDLSAYFQDLTAARKATAFLIISVKDTDKFIQFKYHRKIVQRNAQSYQGVFEIDFPIITPYQKSIEKKFLAVCAEFELEVAESPAHFRHRFHNAYVLGSAAEMGEVVTRMFMEVHGATRNDALTFDYKGFARSAEPGAAAGPKVRPES